MSKGRSLLPDEVLASKALLGDKDTRNAAANEVWDRREVDTMLDMYLGGADPGRIAVTLKRNRKAVIRKLQEYIYNERDRAANYQPRQRESRKGKHLTKNEIQLIQECRKKNVSWKQISLILQRDADEISGQSQEEVARTRSFREIAPTLDLIWANRYIYFVYKHPLISDKAYDTLVQEECEFAGSKGFEAIKSHSGWPSHIRSLALYLIERVKYELAPDAVLFAIGDRKQPGEYGMWFGPTREWTDVLDTPGHDKTSRILELKGDKTRPVAKWSEKKQRWKIYEDS